MKGPFVRPKKPSFLRKLRRAFYPALVIGLLVMFVLGGAWCRIRGCAADQDKVTHVLKGAGYSQIEIGSPNKWRCSSEDTSSREFSALGPTGNYVEGTVCCSLTGCAKGCTVRIDR